jgi:hypothetical protein
MQAVHRLLFGVVAVSLTSACTSLPPRVSPTQHGLWSNQISDRSSSSSSPATSAPGGSSNGGAPTPDRPRDAAASQTNVDNAMRKRGYRSALDRGQRVYCRNETLTGSNLASKVCLTAEQIENQERAGKDILNGNHQAGCLPTKTGCQ